jgi:hypothetical protein
MKSLFDQAAKNEIIERINRLKPDSKAEWGKMNASQVLAHLSQSILTSSGELKLKRKFIGVLLGGLFKKLVIGNDKPFRKSSPTDKSFIITGERNFEQEKTKLISLLEKFSKAGPGEITTEPHPFFGKMTPAEWDTLMMKHLDHHLRQFGV